MSVPNAIDQRARQIKKGNNLNSIPARKFSLQICTLKSIRASKASKREKKKKELELRPILVGSNILSLLISLFIDRSLSATDTKMNGRRSLMNYTSNAECDFLTKIALEN